MMSARAKYGAVSTMLLASSVVLLCGVAQAARLDTDTPVVDSATNTVSLPIRLSVAPAEQVAGLQCDIGLNGSGLRFLKAELGPTASLADKGLNVHETGPFTVRLLLVGLNQNAISSGVVARLELQTEPGSVPTPSRITLGSVVLSDPFGTRVQVTSPGEASSSPTQTGQASSVDKLVPWMAVSLLVVVGALVVLATRAAHQRRTLTQPRHHRAKPRKATKSC